MITLPTLLELLSYLAIILYVGICLAAMGLWMHLAYTRRPGRCASARVKRATESSASSVASSVNHDTSHASPSATR